MTSNLPGQRERREVTSTRIQVHGRTQAHILTHQQKEETRQTDPNTDAWSYTFNPPVGGQVEGHAEALLTGGQVALVESVALLGGAEASVLPHGPGLHRVHGRPRPPGKRELAWELLGQGNVVGRQGLLTNIQVLLGVDGLQGDTLWVAQAIMFRGVVGTERCNNQNHTHTNTAGPSFYDETRHGSDTKPKGQ